MSRHLFGHRAGCVATGLLVAGLLTMLSANPAYAQRQGGGQRGGAGGRMGMLNSPGLNQLMLLRNESVQSDLKLTDDQKSKATALAEKVQSEMQGAFSELGELDPEDREAKMEELRKTAQERGKAVLAEVSAILQPEQSARLKQIGLQMRGIGALADEEVAAELKLSDDQKKQLAAIREQSETEMRDAFRQVREGGGGDRDAMRAKMEGLRKASNDKALAVLNADQKAQFEKMQGPKADVRFEGGPGRGAPGGGQRRRPPGA